MTEQIRAYLIIILLGLTYLKFAKPMFYGLISRKDYKKYSIVSVAIITICFLTPNYWFVVLFLSILLIYFGRDDSQRVILFLLALPLLPMMTSEIPGFGGARIFFVISYQRLLVIILLVPVFVNQIYNIKTTRLFAQPSDKYLISFVLLVCVLKFRDNTVTNSIRECLYIFLDVFVPYFVFSRFSERKEHVKMLFSVFLLSMIFIAILAIFETLKSWHLFTAMEEALLHSGSKFTYSVREGILRSYVSFSGPLVLSYMLVIAISFCLALRGFYSKTNLYAVLGVLAIALLSTLSRGGWLGVVVLGVLYVLFSEKKVRGVFSIFIILSLSLTVVSIFPGGERIIKMIPFIGAENSVATATLDYRVQLFNESLSVIRRYPLFGSTGFLELDEMENLRQGQNIIDLVNRYISIALEYGLVGLGLFVSAFMSAAYQLFKKLKTTTRHNLSATSLDGLWLFALMGSILLMISSISSIDRVPIMYWIICAIAIGFSRVITISESSKTEMKNNE